MATETFALLGGMVLDALDLVAEAERLVDLIECVPKKSEILLNGLKLSGIFSGKDW